MGACNRYGPGQSGSIAVVYGSRCPITWWWAKGGRAAWRGGIVHAWTVDYWGRPTAYAPVHPLRIAEVGEAWAVEETIAMLLRKEDLEGRGGQAARVLTDPRFAGDYPILWSYLTQTKWQDGSPRLTSSLLVFSDDGVLKAMLRDRDAGLCLWVAGGTMSGLFDALEAAVSDSKADWRQDRQQPGQTAKRITRK
jgi:hypothetical protein